MPSPDVTGPRLRALRESSGVRVGELAERAGCSKGHLRMIETTDRRPSPELAHRLARELSKLLGRVVHVSEFYDGRRRREPATKSDDEVGRAA